MALLSTLYDVLNDLVIDTPVGRYDDLEHNLTCRVKQGQGASGVSSRIVAYY